MKRLSVLVLEDSDDDAELLLRELDRSDYDVVYERVQTERDMRAALAHKEWDLVLSDYAMPTFNAPAALRVVKELGIDIPFIIISGTIGEETAVEALKNGAHDFLVKGRLARLVPAIERELRESANRRRKRQAEEELRASEERFRNLVESMDDVVFTLDREQRHDGVFGRWVVREGFMAEHFLGRTAREVLGERAAAPHEEANARALAGERTIYEWSAEGPNGTRTYQTALSPRRGPGGQVVGIVGVGREITEQKRVQAQLVESERMASVGFLAAGVAHEINNPLASVIANLDLAVRGVEELASRPDAPSRMRELREELADARESAERIRDVVRDLKVFSRSEGERRGPVDVQRALESSLRMARNEVRHRARLVRDFAPVPPVDADESRLGQVFLNLIINAAQAIPEGRSESNEIRVATRVDEEERVVVEVQDTGAGIPPDVLDRLFVPFVTTKPVGVGTGLGLSICHRIVTSLGGSIDVKTEVGKGTLFRVRLPRSTAPVATETVARATTAAPARRGRVLVVDDEPAVSSAVRRCLSKEHDVTTVLRADEALARIVASERFDVILCDLMMPEMTGMDLYAELSRIAPDQAERVVFLTGGAFTPEARTFLEQRRSPHVEKPFDVEGLRSLVNERVR